MTIRHYEALRSEIQVVQNQVGILNDKYNQRGRGSVSEAKTALPKDENNDADDEDEEPLFKSKRKRKVETKHRSGTVISFQVTFAHHRKDGLLSDSLLSPDRF